MFTLKMAVPIESFGLPLNRAIVAASQLGVSGIVLDARNTLRPAELSDTGLRQFKKKLSDYNLQIAAVRFPTRRGYDVAQDLDRRIEATKSAMRFAYDLGARVLINSVGRVPAAAVDDKELTEGQQAVRSQLVSSLSDLAHHGQHVGAMLACETGSEPAAYLTGLLRELPEQAIGIAFNPGNLIVNDYFSDSSAKDASEYTLALIAQDGVRDLARGRGMEVPLGQGSVEFPEVLGVLEEKGFDGWIHLAPRSTTTAKTDLANSVSYLKSL